MKNLFDDTDPFFPVPGADFSEASQITHQREKTLVATQEDMIVILDQTTLEPMIVVGTITISEKLLRRHDGTILLLPITIKTTDNCSYVPYTA